MFSDQLAFNPFDKNNDVYCGFAMDACAYGDPMPVVPADEDSEDDTLMQTLSVDSGDEDISLDSQQTKLLKTVVEFLNQVSTPLYFSGNRFLSSAAKDLANQVNDKFCIG